MLTVSNVSVRFGKRSLYEDVNLKFNKGACYGIIGANGAGKSTFLKVLSGELEPSKGEVSKDKNERISRINVKSDIIWKGGKKVIMDGEVVDLKNFSHLAN